MRRLSACRQPMTAERLPAASTLPCLYDDPSSSIEKQFIGFFHSAAEYYHQTNGWECDRTVQGVQSHRVHASTLEGDSDMRAQTQTINQRPRVGVTVDLGGMDWLQRLYQWYRRITQRRAVLQSVSSYGTWDATRERFQPVRPDSAADHVISQSGVAWAERIYGASI
jgi:hypothetical protein